MKKIYELFLNILEIVITVIVAIPIGLFMLAIGATIGILLILMVVVFIIILPFLLILKLFGINTVSIKSTTEPVTDSEDAKFDDDLEDLDNGIEED